MASLITPVPKPSFLRPLSEALPLSPLSALVPSRAATASNLHHYHRTLETIYEEENEDDDIAGTGPSSSGTLRWSETTRSTCSLELKMPFLSSHGNYEFT
ncbi:hypothetical protein EUGRSUZ_D00275 [Eucalyptus grandis]|uniref:Uncharacterized protein n=2 Tax=Eucalyptus grandis TaxID=71139 RepID=A0ACC3L1Y7_EUCGR|nr:hypothetical protein EUGRSUZ_D00275 [Eucalyptus grandis]